MTSTSERVYRRDGNGNWGWVTEEPNGGSQPQLFTFTAAQIVARYNADLDTSYMEIPADLVGTAIVGVYEYANDLDSGQSNGLPMIWTSGATTQELNDHGIGIREFTVGNGDNPPVIALTATASSSRWVVSEGGALYADIGNFNNVPPSTGSITIGVVS